MVDSFSNELKTCSPFNIILSGGREVCKYSDKGDPDNQDENGDNRGEI